MILFYQISNWLSRGIDSGPLWPMMVYFTIYPFLILWAFLYGRIRKKKGIHLLRDVVCLPASFLLLLTPIALLQLTGYITWASWIPALIPVLEGIAFFRLFHAHQIKNTVSTTLARMVAFQTAAIFLAVLVVCTTEAFSIKQSPLPTLAVLLLWYGFVDLWRSQRMLQQLKKAGIKIVSFKHMALIFAITIPAFCTWLFGEVLCIRWLQYTGIAIGIIGILLIVVWMLKNITKFGRSFFHVILLRLITSAASVFLAFFVAQLALLLVVDQEFLEESVTGIANLWSFAVGAAILAAAVYVGVTLLLYGPSAKELDERADQALYDAALTSDANIKLQKYNKASRYKNWADDVRNCD